MVDYKVTATEFGQRPPYKEPDAIFLKELGEEGFYQLMSDFYDLVIESDISNFFPQDEAMLEKVKLHNTKFFVEVCGGTKAYTQQMGHVDMVKMHEEFSIPEKARLEWLGCMREILDKQDISDAAKQTFWDYVEVFSKHLVNEKPKPTTYEDLVKV
ncbi:MAG: globin [Campylobacterota bacterium]